jgi:hypothetical protein
MWCSLAAQRFRKRERREFAERSRDEVARKMTPAQIAQAKELARNFKPKASAPAR